ncbi:L-fucose operon activator [Lactobacillus helveticus DSM 20075 = CGMCC 1.1877]|nr:L-fucose operon activator [Lactobacillus helveticus DSM 20075 = CGMCC 1.1877]
MHDMPNRSARIVRLDVRTFFGAQIVSVVCGINLHLHTETGGARFFCISIINPNANHFTLYLMVTKSASNLISNLAKHDFNLLCLRVITHEHLTIVIVFFHIYWVVTLIMQSKDANDLEANIKRAFSAHADAVVLLVDHTKIGKHQLYMSAPMSAINYIVTDKSLPETIFNTARNNHVQVFEGLEFLVLESISIPKVLGPNLKRH